jgi:murein DD-endopeptidase MepM/ murein hydrolase activator NlpD
MIYPIAKSFRSYITQGYGLTDFAKSPRGRASYKNFPGGIHPGVDFGTGGVNADIISLVKGKVIKATMDGGWGNHIEIQAEDGWNRQYAHLSLIRVAVGQKIEPGDVLGKVGNTGASTGTHLHYGKRRWVLLPYPRYEYADPSSDFDDSKKIKPEQKAPELPKTLLVKGSDPDVFVMSKKGTTKHQIPNWLTLVRLFGDKPDIGIADQALLNKIPEGEPIPDLSL